MHGGLLYFFADDGVVGDELWSTDGTDPGTVLVVDVGPGSQDVNFYGSPLVRSNGLLFFLGDDGISGRELWKSDGTAVGTEMVTDLLPGDGWGFNSFTIILDEIDDTLYFAAEDGISGLEPWQTDGSELGTVLVDDVAAGPADSEPNYQGFIKAGANTFFIASDADHGPELRVIAVPEPAFGAMLFAGVLLLRTLARRRAR